MVSLLTSDAFVHGLVVGIFGGVLWIGSIQSAGMIHDISVAGFVWVRIIGLFGYALMVAGPSLAALDVFMGIGRVLLADEVDDEFFDD